MTTPARQHGKGGRIPRNPERPVPILEQYIVPRSDLAVASSLTRIPLSAEVDRSSKVPSWPMYANDSLGDCTCAAAGHMVTAWSAFGSGAAVSFTDTVIIGLYSKAGGYVPGDPSTDNGADMQTVLEVLRQDGIADTSGKVHKVAAYAMFGNSANEVLRGSVLETFGTVYDGFNCPESALTEFDNGQVWTYEPASPNDGGHAVCMQHRYPAGSEQGISEWVTWGALQRGTFGFIAQYFDESYCVVSQDYVDAAGVSPDGYDLEQLLADMASVS